jgi:asparagine synthase (glutamine-hydrolysing)
MCGIFCYKGHQYTTSQLKELTNTIQHRGPDETKFEIVDDVFMGFHRLSINGLDEVSGQPMRKNGVYMMCNGEIFNYLELSKKYNIKLETKSDCEIILQLYFVLDMDELCCQLDGDFAFVIYDSVAEILFIARDSIGIRSLYYAIEDDNMFVSSEMKSIPVPSLQFPPGHVFAIDKTRNEVIIQNRFYHFVDTVTPSDEDTIVKNINLLLEKAVDKRLLSDRPIGCILSGGLDSTIVTAIVNQKKAPGAILNTYTIGLEGSTDLFWAKKAAEYFGTTHHEFVVSEEEFLSFIPYTIRQIESFDVTTVRASVGNYLVAKKISETTEDKVIFCGDVSDELFGSYRGFQNAGSDYEFFEENLNLMKNIHYFDVLRAEKSVAGAGLEARVPYSDKDFMSYVMMIPPKMKMFDSVKIEKYLLRKAFHGYLPEDLLWRRKEAFSDGVSSKDKSWFEIIQEHVDQLYTDEEYTVLREKYTHMKPYNKESLWYREIFESYYPGQGESIPYFWRQPFSNILDPSARLLKDY